MLFNNSITISSLSSGASTNGKRTWSDPGEAFEVYINQIQEDKVEGFDWGGAWYAFRMMTDWNHDTIKVADRVTDENWQVYEVRGKSISSDITGVHHQYLLIVKAE